MYFLFPSKITYIGCIALCMLLLSTKPISIESSQVMFTTEDFDKVLGKAYSEYKYIFMNTNAQSCMRCPAMNSQLFKDPQVADFYNSQFINYYLDLDNFKYSNFGSIHNLDNHPAMFFFAPNGLIKKRVVNVLSPEELIALGNIVINTEGRKKIDETAFSNMENEYLIGNRKSNLLYDYAYALRAFDRPYNSVVKDYIEQQQEEDRKNGGTGAVFQQHYNRKFIYDFLENVDNPVVDKFIEDIDHFKRTVGGPQVNEKVKIAVHNGILTAVKDRDEKLFRKALDIVDKAYLEDRNNLKFYFITEYLQSIRDWDRLIVATKDHFKKYGETDPAQLLYAAQRFNAFARKSTDLKVALGWIDESIKITETYDNVLTKARLLRRLERDKEASEFALKAINIGKAENEKRQGAGAKGFDYSEAERLYDKLISQ